MYVICCLVITGKIQSCTQTLLEIKAVSKIEGNLANWKKKMVNFSQKITLRQQIVHWRHILIINLPTLVIYLLVMQM